MDNKVLINDNQRISKLTTQLKLTKIDNFFKNKYCDVLDSSNSWCVAEIIDRKEDKVKIHFEGWSNKYDDEVSIKSGKISPFRKFTKCYTGQKTTAYRLYNFKIDDLSEIKNSLNNLLETKLDEDFLNLHPLDITQLIRGKIYTWIDIFMTCQFNAGEISQVPEVINLLYAYLDFSVIFLRFFINHIELTEISNKYPDLFLVDKEFSIISCYNEILNTLIRIFARDNRTNSLFRTYDNCIDQSRRVPDCDRICRPVMYKISISFEDIPVCIISNFVDYFNFIGGFKLIFDIIFVERLRENITFSGTPLKIIFYFFQIFEYVSPFIDYKLNFITEISKFKEYIFHRISNISESEIKEVDKSIIEGIALSMKVVYNFDGDGKISGILYEEIKLMYFHQCFVSKYLEKRIKGITYINNIVEELIKKDYMKLINVGGNDSETEEVHIDINYLFNWLREKSILEIILGKNIHEEILKRSFYIFCLYVKYNKLDPSIFDIMWNSIFDKHESISREIQNLIIELSSFMNEKDKIYMFEKIKLFDFKIYNSNLLKFIKNLTINCITSEKILHKDNFNNEFLNINLYGIPTLWYFMMDKSDQVEIAFEYLTEIFTSCKLQDEFLTKYLIMSLENIKSAKSVVQSLKIFKILANQISVSVSHNKLRGNTDEVENLIVILDEKYSIIELIVNDLKRYFEENIYIRNDLYLTEMQENEFMLKIFEGFYNHQTNIEKRLELILFLFHISGKNKMRMTIEQILVLWDVLILKSTTEVEKNIFYNFLLKSNQTHEIINQNIIQCETDELSEKISEDLFNRILTRRDNFPPEKMNFIAFLLFTKYFNIVNISKGRISIIDRKIKIANSEVYGMDYLWEILTDCPNENVRRECCTLITDLCLNLKYTGEEFCIKIWTQFMNKLLITIQKCTDELEVNFTSERVYGVILLLKKFAGIYKTEREGQESMILESKNINPRNLIIENEFIFQKLFELLNNFNSCYISELWELINMLPRNRIIEDEIFNLGRAVDANNSNYKNLTSINNLATKYLNPQSLYKLAYSLEIVKVFVEKSSDWAIQFASNGGVTFLVKIISHVNESYFENSLGFSCINNILFLIELINEYYVRQNFSIFKNEFMKNYESLIILKLFQVVYFIFKSSYDKSENSNSKKMQLEYSKQRNKEIIYRQFFKNNKNKDSHNEVISIINDDEIDEIHPIIRGNMNDEIKQISITLKFIDNFDPEKVIRLLIGDINIDINFNYLSNKYDENPNVDPSILNKLLTWCLIFPNNNTIKNNLFEYLLKLLNNVGNNKELINKFYIYFFTNILKPEVLILPEKVNVINSSDIFFKLICLFLNRIFSDQNKLSSDKKLLVNVNFLQITEFLISYIENEKIRNNSPNNNTNLLIGFMNILRELILSSNEINKFVDSRNLLDFLMDELLFPLNRDLILSPGLATFSHPIARLAAYKLLSAILYNKTKLIKKIINKLTEYHNQGFWRSKKTADWTILYPEEKSLTGFTGLKNLGCTCYMNSLLQQLYMIPTLRKSILSTDEKFSSLLPPDQSVLYQLKIIFASLLLGNQKFYNPKEFCMNFKNYDGNIMNIYQQMDVDEFFNLLIDRLEPFLKNTVNENLLKNHFGGTICNELISKGCQHSSERNEYFTSIILQVLNKKSICESLQEYVKGDTLEGENAYYCESCNKKVNALKRQYIKSFPQILVLVLKRFEFDFNVMRKTKVNDYCEFPMELDMEPFTRNHLGEYVTNAGDCKYYLTGVIIHTGTADSGHYYSIIKNANNWYEFNDSHVTPYDIADLPVEAFGSKLIAGQSDSEINKSIKDKNTNAYVLLYTKDIANKMEIDEVENINTDCSFIQTSILDTVKSNNYQFCVNKIIFSNEYCDFVQDLINNYNLCNVLDSDKNNLPVNYHMITKNMNTNIFPSFTTRPFDEIINLNIPNSLFIQKTRISGIDFQQSDFNDLFKFICLVFFTGVIRLKEKKYIPAFMDIIKTLINLFPENADWILEEFSNIEIITEFLVDCPLPEMKYLSVGLIYCAMIKSFESLLKTNFEEKEEELTLNCISNSPAILNFIKSILYLISKKKQFVGKDFTFLYFIVWRFSLLGIEAKKILVKKNLIEFLYTYYMTKSISTSSINLNNNNSHIYKNLEDILLLKVRQPMHQELKTKLIIKNEKLSTFEELFEKKQLEKNNVQTDCYLFYTLCEIFTSHKVKSLSQIPFDDDLSSINFTDKIFIKILLSEARNKLSTVYVSKLLIILCSNNLEMSNSILAVLIEMILISEYIDSDSLMKIFSKLIMIDDNFTDERISIYMIKYLNSITEKNLQYHKYTEFHIDFLIKFFSIQSKITNYIIFYCDYIKVLIKWIKDNPFPPLYQPSKTTTMFKRRTINYSNINISPSSHKEYIDGYKEKNALRIQSLLNIINNTHTECRDFFDSDEILIDFKFSVNDKIRYNNFECSVKSVLDEMILLEFKKDLLSSRKLPINQWVTTDKDLNILDLNNMRPSYIIN